MKRSWFALLVCCTIGLSACAATPPTPEVMLSPEQRMAMKSYSFTIPSESGWCVRGRSSDKIMIGKLGSNQDESFLLIAQPVGITDSTTTRKFLDYVKASLELDVDDRRYRNVRHDVTAMEINGLRCALSDAEAEDQGAVTRSGRRDPMILQIKSVVCVDPRRENAGVSLGYSHRHYPEHRDPMLDARAMEIFRSLTFLER